MKLVLQAIVVLLLGISAFGLKLTHDLDEKSNHYILLSRQEAIHAKEPDQVHFNEFIHAYALEVNSGDSRTTMELQYKDNVKEIIEENNDASNTFSAGINQFAALSQEQFEQTYLTLKKPAKKPQVDPSTDGNSHLKLNEISHQEMMHLQSNSSSVNWQRQMTKVKQQGKCGSCWSFTITAEVEGRIKIKTGQDNDLSEQQLIDCNTQGHDCNGGWYDAYNYVVSNGYMRESDYPYVGRKQRCNYNSGRVVARISRSRDLYWQNSCTPLIRAIQDGPVSVAVHTATSDWEFYSKGILNICRKGQNVDHAVLLVGYDASCAGVWIIKNSWGTSWGEQGYIRMQGGNCNNICEDGYWSVV